MPSRAAPRTSSQQRRHERTLFVHWLAAAVDGADKRLLAALFRALEASFGFGPADLGMLMVGQNLALALSAPVWGQLADASRERIRLLAAGSALWGLWTALFAGATSFYQMLALRVLTLGRYPPPRGEPHSEEAVALFGFFVALALLLWWLL